MSLLDRGAILGLGLFETLLALDGVPVFLDRHLARLRLGCERLDWNLQMPDFHEIAAELLVRNNLTSGRVRIRLAVSGGSGSINDLALGKDRVVTMIARPVDAERKLAASWLEMRFLCGESCRSRSRPAAGFRRNSLPQHRRPAL